METSETTQNPAETRKLSILLEKQREKIGNYRLIEVEGAGYIVELTDNLPIAGNDWIFFDYDDTLVAYTETKKRRLEKYREFLESQNLETSKDEAEEAIQIADEFARWPEDGTKATYHHNAHLTILSWITSRLKDQPKSPKEQLTQAREILAKVREKQVVEDAPFHLNQNNRLVLHTKTPWDREMEDIFTETTLKPAAYEEMIEAAILASNPNSANRTNLAVLTYGEPYYQLTKVIETLGESSNFKPSQLWLTKIPKGEFFEKVVETKANSRLQLEYAPGEISQTLSLPAGYPLGETHHTVIVFDDNPREILSVVKSSEALSHKSKASIVCVRSIRPQTREETSEWEVETPYGEIDFRTKPVAGQDIHKIIEINRYLAMKNSLGENHPNVLQERNRLTELGVTET